MENMALILAAAVITYLTRIAGFALNPSLLSPRLHAALAYIPIAAFSALAVPGIATGSGTLDARLAGALAAALVIYRFSALWAGLTAGMLVFWLVQWVA